MALALALLGCGGGGVGGGGVGGLAALPDVAVVELDTGTSVSLADISGPAVINVWATSCAPCRAEMPAFQQVYRERGVAVGFFGLNVGETAEVTEHFIDELGISYPQLLDELGYASTALGATGLPATYIIDADGTVVLAKFGVLDTADLNTALDQL